MHGGLKRLLGSAPEVCFCGLYLTAQTKFRNVSWGMFCNHCLSLRADVRALLSPRSMSLPLYTKRLLKPKK